MNSFHGNRAWQTTLVTSLSLILMAALLAGIFLWSPNFRDPIPGGDYLHFYLAARIFREGRPDQLYDFDYQIRLQNDPTAMPFHAEGYVSALYIYPPFFVWFCLPFSYLPFKIGAIAWTLFMSGCLVAALLILFRGGSARSWNAFGPVLLLSLLFTPTLISLASCQNGTLALLILCATYGLLQAGKPALAGTVFALLAFKPQFTLVIAAVMLCKGQWRFVLGGILGGLVLVAASLAVSPVASISYVKLGPILSHWIDLPNLPLAEMSSWRGFWRLLLKGLPVSYAEAASLASSALTLAVMATAFKGPLQSTAPDFPLRFALLVLATVLVSPHLLAYDLTVLLVPMVLALRARPVAEGFRARDPIWILTAALFLVASLSRWMAAATGFQPVVPLAFVYLVALAGWLSRSRGLSFWRQCGLGQADAGTTGAPGKSLPRYRR